ncbi:MAG: tRNA (adenosine(37)-N6)-threonylcarbamoyltransferase complex transferase subunit TsaD [Leptospiraceae bacterium]|nr:tRNA (adenosine(37)-N6)-threonylcarbamoyltransferase complex transferase subunit TsaD [Leptospiraceae bacterium]
MLVLGIESSCDESAIGIVKDGRDVLFAPIYSQINLHKKFGGIVPENASRAHLEKFHSLVSDSINFISQNSIKMDYISVTVKPGLVGSLLVGYNTALAIAHFLKIPLLPVHHLEAHFSAISLSGLELSYPSLGLLVSGGNTSLFILHGPGNLEKIGDTLDDAAGEALDKAASLLGFEYPGGPAIEKAALQFLDSTKISAMGMDFHTFLPDILKETSTNDLRFSFSGIKTALYYALKKKRLPSPAAAYLFQEKLVEHISRNVQRALKKTQLKTFIAAGGVLANTVLRNSLSNLCKSMGVDFQTPEKKYCTDNGPMVAAAGYMYAKNNIFPKQNFVTSDNSFEFREFRS